MKKDWDPTKWSLAHILGVIRCLLIIPFPESSLNEEAGKLFMDNYEEYARMAKLMTKIHATKNKKSCVKNIDENNNSNRLDLSNIRMKDDEIKEAEKHIKFQFQSSSNLDASMEEEKEPLQNFWLNSGYQLGSSRQFGQDSNEENMKIPQYQNSSVVNGACLFGAKADGDLKKPKPKKKKMRRI